ncbi:MAG: extracellular solute-binding protein [Fervidobacterium sp.]|uniref:extracellular solute-binding protein n=1 Tax=Fervidobacterium sp. TaxID=1871331 RepID=UPI00404A952C
MSDFSFWEGTEIIRKVSITIVIVFSIIFFTTAYAQDYEKVNDIDNYRTYYKTLSEFFTAPLVTGETLWGSPQLSVDMQAGDSIEFEILCQNPGVWNIRLDYVVTSRQILPPEVFVTLNNGVPFIEAQGIPLIQFWKYEEGKFPKNRYDDEVLPNQYIVPDVISYYLKSPTGIEKEPLFFKIDPPTTRLKITLKSGSINLKRVVLERPAKPQTYTLPKGVKERKKETKIVIEAEHPQMKSDPSTNAIALRTSEVVPYTTYNLLLNAFGGDNWKQPGQIVTYSFEVPQDGYYKLAVKYLQNSKPDFTSFRTVYIDGKVLYEDMIYLPFEYTTNWKIETLKARNGEPLYFYLKKGIHTVSLEVNASVYSNVLNDLKSMIDYINDLALKVKYMSGGQTDRNIEWEIRDYFPDIDEELSYLISKTRELKKEIAQINKNTSNSEYVSLNIVEMLLERLKKDPNKIPNRIEMLVGSTGSVLSELSNAYNGLQQMPLTIDQIYIYQGENIDKTVKVSFLKIFLEGLKRFVHSFTKQKLYAETIESKVVLEVWVNRPRQYVDILQQLVDKEFTPKTGIYVDLSIMRDEGKLILANAAKRSPDIALGISNWIPFEMGIRGAALDLRRFSDFVEFSKNFYPGSLLPYLYEEHCYGLPETLDFYVLFYRTDIINYLKIPIPNTWEDVKTILPELQRNGMNFYLPLGGSTSFKAWMTTAPFIYQYHGKLFTEDGLKTAIGDSRTLRALKEMTELFTMYGIPTQVANFFESFRKGEIPIGVGNLGTYVQLTIAAPELKGMWSIVPSPGVEWNGVVERWQTGSAQAVAIFNDTKYPMESWEFVKWWLSEETQRQFINQVVSTYGIEFLMIPANRNAVSWLPIRQSDLSVIKSQFEWLQEVPKMPASYILEREISNIWNKVVLEGKPLRVAVDDGINVVNKEFARKLEEFGYYKNGKPVRPFKIYELEDILSWYK